MRDHGSGLHQSGNLGLVFVVWVIHGFPLGAITQVIVDTLGHECLLQIKFQDSMFAGVVSQQSLFVFTLKAAFSIRARVGATVGKNFVNSFLEMFHHKMVLLLSVFVFGFWLKSTQFTSVSCSEPICIFR